MTITLSMTSETQKELEQCAAAQGTDVPGLIQGLIERSLKDAGEDRVSGMPRHRWQEEFRRFIASQQSQNPQFDDSRESIYD